MSKQNGWDKELPLLPSDKKNYENKIKELKAERDQIHAACHRKFNGIILRALYLTTEQKENLIEELLK